MRDMIRIVLADDHQVVRRGVRALFEDEDDFDIIGEVSEGLNVVDTVEKLKPDILVLDLMMPGLNGLEIARQLKRRVPYTKVVILSMHSNEAYVLEALREGVMGYVLKDSNITDLVEAVRLVHMGQRYLSPPLSERAIEIYMQKVDFDITDPYDTLTTREREVFQLTVEGNSRTEIAGKLSISPRTVDKHRDNLMSKLGFNSQAELIRFALKRGILPMDE